jgi:hypothetical protein
VYFSRWQREKALFFDGVEEEHGCLAAWEAKAGVATSETGRYEAVRPSSRQVLSLGAFDRMGPTVI